MNIYKSVSQGKERNNVIHCFGTEVMYAKLKKSKKGSVACGCWSMFLDGSCAIASSCSSYLVAKHASY